MPTERYIAPVSELIDVSQIPGDFQAIESLAQNGIDFLLQNIFYKNYVADKSSSSDTAYYHLVIVTKALRLPIFGTGLDIVFFKGSDANYSEFPITFDVIWPIRKYFSNFKLQGFSYAPQAMIDIFLELTNTDERTFYGEIVTTFLDSGNNEYLTFFTTLKGNIESYLGESTEADTEIMNISVQLDLLKGEVEDMLTTTNLYTARDIEATDFDKDFFNLLDGKNDRRLPNKNHLQTIRVSLEMYENLGINLAAVVNISIKFPPVTGEKVNLDNFMFTN